MADVLGPVVGCMSSFAWVTNVRPDEDVESLDPKVAEVEVNREHHWARITVLQPRISMDPRETLPPPVPVAIVKRGGVIAQTVSAYRAVPATMDPL
jgi:hypothetical protein